MKKFVLNFALFAVASSSFLHFSDGLLVRTRKGPQRALGEVPQQQPLFSAAPKNGGLATEFMEPSTMSESLKNAAGTALAFPRDAFVFIKNMCGALHWRGFTLYLLLGWLLEPAMEKPYNMFQKMIHSKDSEKQDETSSAKPYRSSLFRLVTDHVAQASKIAFSVYVVDAARIALQALGVTNIPYLGKLPHAYMRSAYTFWIADRIAACKRHFVARKTNSHPENLPPKVQLVNRIIDVSIYAAGFLGAIAAVRADLGTAAKGFVALGSFSTLVVSLATQNVASQLVSGVFIDFTDKLNHGDAVRFGNQGEGARVEKMGWLNTVMRGPDDAKVVVPNKALVDKEISNLSRVKTSQVKQTLKFKYEDVHKLPQLMVTVKEEIKRSCPEVITDGSRPFRAHWTDFGSKLEVVVDCHLNVPPTEEKYWDARQEMLVAIARAVEQEGLEFAP